MLTRKGPSQRSISRISNSGKTTTSLLASVSSHGNRGFATVQDTPIPKRVYGGLRDQDRIFQNLYGRNVVDLKTAKKYGDWYKTKDILAKGHDWV